MLKLLIKQLYNYFMCVTTRPEKSRITSIWTKLYALKFWIDEDDKIGVTKKIEFMYNYRLRLYKCGDLYLMLYILIISRCVFCDCVINAISYVLEMSPDYFKLRQFIINRVIL